MHDRLSALAATAMVALLALLHACTLDDSPVTSPAADPAVKLSRSEICHACGTDGYNQTKSYTAFDTLEACLQIGRLPRGNTAADAEPVVAAVPAYDRDAFGSWIDADHDCLNTRHEILQELSTAVVEMKSGFSVGRGRRVDPYTDLIFTEAKDLDIDHVVPLSYAWQNAAHAWSADKRVAFANDPANLLAVQAAANRSKGRHGPTEWLPPSGGYRCQYILCFQRVAAPYHLIPSSAEDRALQDLPRQYCRYPRAPRVRAGGLWALSVRIGQERAGRGHQTRHFVGRGPSQRSDARSSASNFRPDTPARPCARSGDKSSGKIPAT